MNLTNNAALLIKVYGETFHVLYVAKTIEAANAFMSGHPDSGFISEDSQNSLFYIAKNQPESA